MNEAETRAEHRVAGQGGSQLVTMLAADDKQNDQQTLPPQKPNASNPSISASSPPSTR